MTRLKSMMERTHEEPGVSAGFQEEATCETAPYPSAFLEYSWFVILAYATLGQAWGVVIPLVGGALMALLAAACLLSVGDQTLRVYAPFAWALCTGVFVIAVQFLFFSARSLDNSIVFIGWLLEAIIVQALALRPRFLHRFALAASVIGLGALPYMNLDSGVGFVRARAAETGIGNANSMGMWFGFLAVYFLFIGVQSRTLILRAVYWAGALGSLYVVGLTVSRGPLLGILLACVVGLHSVLKRSFYPVLSLVLLMWLVYESGLFQQAVDSYTVRGTVETGRGKVWPLALERLFDSPWTGVGMEAIPTLVAWRRAITPHNALLYIGLAAGIIPVICFLGYLARAVSGALHIMRRVPAGEATFIPPLVTFALIELMSLDTAFMSAWVVTVFALASLATRPRIRLRQNPLHPE